MKESPVRGRLGSLEEELSACLRREGVTLHRALT